MIAVIFELQPRAGQADRYFDLAASLDSTLRTIDGFISVERFESVAQPGRYLSLSFWRDEDAVAAWRNTQGHRGAQREGRNAVLHDYRLRVASVLRDYALTARDQVPSDSQAVHDV